MANYRQIHVSIWKDTWFLDLEPDEKLLFIYLFSNENTSLSGLYKIAMRVIAFETGLSEKFVKDTLDKFAEQSKVLYEGDIVWVKNLRKYNRGGATVEKRIASDILEIPECSLKKQYIAYYDPNIHYDYTTDTLSYEMKCNEDECNEDSEKYPTYLDDAGALRVYTKVTGHMTFPSKTRADAIGAIQQINIHKNGDVIDYLKPFWEEWRSRDYHPSNTSWLTEWAVTGKVPERKADKDEIDPASVAREVYR